MQQSYAGCAGLLEQVNLTVLVEDALKINMQGIQRHEIKVEKIFEEIPTLYIDKHKAMQIIINLISNAKNALVDAEKDNNEHVSRMTITVK